VLAADRVLFSKPALEALDAGSQPAEQPAEKDAS